jgi:hypothetical protein
LTFFGFFNLGDFSFLIDFSRSSYSESLSFFFFFFLGASRISSSLTTSIGSSSFCSSTAASSSGLAPLIFRLAPLRSSSSSDDPAIALLESTKSNSLTSFSPLFFLGL